MRRYFPIVAMLLTLLFTVRLSAQNEEPQLAEYQLHPNPDARLDHAFLAMYDLDFAKADAELSQFVAEKPNDPVGPAAQAASVLFAIFEQHKVLQAEFFASDGGYAKRHRVMPDEPSRKHFEEALSHSESLATQALASNSADVHSLFALTLASGLRADYAALIEHRDSTALHFSDIGTGWAAKLLAISPDFCDAYVATGVQKYLVSLKPAPMRWMLRLGGIKGDQDQGIRDLQLAADKGRYLAPFARILLTVAHLRKQERDRAFTLLADLHQQFPHNPLFVEEMAKLQAQLASPQANLTSMQSREKGQ
jgi:hypothetical protein